MRGAENASGRLKLRLHPLFGLAGLVSALTGDLMLFLAATLAALEHECAHSLVARRFGFRLSEIVLMPYGAVVSGDIAGMPPRQEIAVCLAGPLVNALTALGFAGLWWLYPETYAFTDAAAQVSFSLFLVNLFPAFPLDGGRILRVLLRPLGEKRAGIVCRAVTLCFSLGLAGFFLASCLKGSPNAGAALFAVLLACGSFGGKSYSRLTFTRSKNFRRGIEEKRIALSSDVSLGEAMHFLREDKYVVFILFEGNEFLGELPEEEFLTALERGDYSKPLKACLTV